MTYVHHQVKSVWWKGKSRIMIDAGGGDLPTFGQAEFAKLEDLDLWVSILPYRHVNDLPALLKGGCFFRRGQGVGDFNSTAGSSLTLTVTSRILTQIRRAIPCWLIRWNRWLFPVNLTDVDYQSTVPTVVYEKDGFEDHCSGIHLMVVLRCLAYRIENEEGVMVIQLTKTVATCVLGASLYWRRHNDDASGVG
ncbi:hypothetical protein O9929_27795 [Vibrio lentus]|nr:hypothetical protein [Vibrio lentus]